MATRNSSRSSGDGHVVIQSSILLLQERFKQLQKEKELREQRDLLKIFGSSSPSDHRDHEYLRNSYHSNKCYCNGGNMINATTTTSTTTTTTTSATTTMQGNYEPSKAQLLFLHPELLFPTRPNFSSKHPTFQQQQQSKQQQQQLVSLSLWPTSYSKQHQGHDDHGVFGMDKATLPLSMVVPASTSTNSNYNKFDDSSVPDVDTSLHL